MEFYSVTTGRIDVFKRKSRQAAKYMKKQKGFLAIHTIPEMDGTLWLYDSLNNAKGARNNARSVGIECGHNICKFDGDFNEMNFICKAD